LGAARPKTAEKLSEKFDLLSKFLSGNKAETAFPLPGRQETHLETISNSPKLTFHIVNIKYRG